MFTLKNLANVISLIGTGCGLFSRVPQVIKTYKSKSANDLWLISGFRVVSGWFPGGLPKIEPKN